jgi:hypothetical protein
MPISITGTGTITGLSAGGLPDDCITTAEIAGSAVTPAKLSGAQSGSAPIFGARAWVYFDGTRNEGDTGASTDGANVKIRGSGNVASVLKNSTGDYTVTFTVAMADTNYAVVGMIYSANPGQLNIESVANNVAGSSRLTARQTNGTSIDPTFVGVAFFR